MCLIAERDLSRLNPLETGEGEPYAIFVPAVSSTFAAFLNKDWSRYPNRPRPKLINKDFSSLNFLDPDSPLFHYKWALYSFGHAKGNERMFRDRNKQRTVVIGDSGGFQLATGAAPINLVTAGANELAAFRQRTLEWLQATADVALTLDVPTAAISEKKSPIRSFQDCLQYTIANHKHFEASLDPNLGTTFLNVVQGRTLSEQAGWIDAVRCFDYAAGWSFPYAICASFEMLLWLVCKLKHDGLLNGASYLHILGCSRLRLAMMMTPLMRALRRYVNPDLLVTYDASNATFLGGKFKRAYLGWRPSQRTGDPTFIIPAAPQGLRYVGSTEPFPFIGSPVGRSTQMGDYNVDRNAGDRTFDDVGNTLLMSHNLFYHIRAIHELNRLLDTALSGGARSTPLGDSYVLAAQAVERIISKKSFQEAQVAIADNVKTLRFIDRRALISLHEGTEFDRINWATDDFTPEYGFPGTEGEIHYDA